MEPSSLAQSVIVVALIIAGATAWSVSRGRKNPGPGGLTPYGTGGFLGLYIIVSRYIGPIFGGLMILGEFSSLKSQNPAFYASNEMGQYMLLTWAYFAVIVVLSWASSTKLKNEFAPSSLDFAVKALIAVAVATPLFTVALLYLVLKVSNSDVLADTFMKTAIQGLMSCGVWIAYLKMSKRVKNTYILGPQILARERAPAKAPAAINPSTPIQPTPAPAPATSTAAPAPTVRPAAASPVATMPVAGPPAGTAPAATPPAAAPRLVDTTTSSPPSPVATAAPKVDTTTRQVAQSTTVAMPAELDADHFFALALSEFEGPQRNRGRWARLFAASGGNESAAQAAYLQETAQELQAAHRRELEAELQRRAEEDRLVRERAKLLMEKPVGHNGEYLLKQFVDGSATVTGADGKARIFGNVDQAMTWVRGQA